jgi:autotransporter-associated beta strand protein
LVLDAGTETIGNLSGAGELLLGSGALTINQTLEQTYARVISGTGGVVKAGAETLILEGANPYTGGTRITTGTLALAHTGGNALADTGSVEIGADGSLTLAASETIGSLSGAGTADFSTWLGTALTINQSIDGTFSGRLIGGTVAKQGAAALVLTGYDSDIGTILMKAGLPRIEDSRARDVIVEANGTLGGNGTIENTVEVESSGVLAPRASAGRFTITAGLSLGVGAHLAIELYDATADTGYDQVVVSFGAVDLDGAEPDLSLLDGFDAGVGATFTILDNQGTDAIGGTFAGLAEGATFGVDTAEFQISDAGGDGNDIVLIMTSFTPPPMGACGSSAPRAPTSSAPCRPSRGSPFPPTRPT